MFRSGVQDLPAVFQAIQCRAGAAGDFRGGVLELGLQPVGEFVQGVSAEQPVHILSGAAVLD
jgi:hypothetical protein